jgi:succinate dehydrogenase / fumarate reductase cytochrome b subunit
MLAGTPRRDTASIPMVRPRRRGPRPWLLELYGSAIGKKAVMAVTGIVLLGFVLVHMIGNLKLYYREPAHLNEYGEWLRSVGSPVLPESLLLWIVRALLILAFVLHIHAAATLTALNRKARPVSYKSRRDYAAANYAARTMRWTGIIVGAFVLFHLFDLTWGQANPDFVHGEPYRNVVESFSRWPVATVYIVANLLLGVHIYHGAWSLFQSLGWNHARFNQWRKGFAAIFAAVIVIGNVSFPIAVLSGAVS